MEKEIDFATASRMWRMRSRQAQAILDRHDMLRQGGTATAFHEHAPERQCLIEVRADVAFARAGRQVLQ
jgi:hypothetical protein